MAPGTVTLKTSDAAHNPSLLSLTAVIDVSFGKVKTLPYMWVILCPRRKHHTNVGGRLAPPAHARKRSDVTRGHMWAIKTREPIRGLGNART